VAGEQHAEFIDPFDDVSLRIRFFSWTRQLRPANSCTDSTASLHGW